MVETKHASAIFQYCNNDPKKRAIAIGAGLAILAGVGYFVYSWRWTHRQQVGQRVVVEALQEYKKLFTGGSTWNDIENVFELGALQAAGSTLAPYVQQFRAVALVEQDKRAEGLVLADQVLAQLPARSPYKNLFETTKALMLLDGSGAEVENGRRSLEQLARDTQNLYRDMALYYLGEYEYSRGNHATAIALWDELLAAFPVSDERAESSSAATVIAQGAVSPWARAAQEHRKGFGAA